MGSEAQAVDSKLIDASFEEAIRRQDLKDTARNREIKEFCDWWKGVAANDLGHYLQKAAIYGSIDLEIMGAAEGIRGNAVGPGAGQISAIMFYALGKVARAYSALKAGSMPSEDTLDDLVIYGMMARYILKHGGLPNVR